MQNVLASYGTIHGYWHIAQYTHYRKKLILLHILTLKEPNKLNPYFVSISTINDANTDLPNF